MDSLGKPPGNQREEDDDSCNSDVESKRTAFVDYLQTLLKEPKINKRTSQSGSKIMHDELLRQEVVHKLAPQPSHPKKRKGKKSMLNMVAYVTSVPNKETAILRT